MERKSSLGVMRIEGGKGVGGAKKRTKRDHAGVTGGLRWGRGWEKERRQGVEGGVDKGKEGCKGCMGGTVGAKLG